MTNDEGMTKPEIAHEVDGSVAADDDPTFVREERDTMWVYHQEERIRRFGGAMIDLAKTIRRGLTRSRIISQLVGSGTSIGENYVEADDAVSKKEFKNHRHLQERRAKRSIFCEWSCAPCR